MPIKLNDTFGGKIEAVIPQNRGMSTVANEKLSQVVGQANRKYLEAIKTDGVPCRVWQNNLRRSKPCSCSYKPSAVAGRATAGTSNLLPRDGNRPNVADPMTMEIVPTQLDVNDIESFTVRGEGVTRNNGNRGNGPLTTPDPVTTQIQMDVGLSGEENNVPNSLDKQSPNKEAFQDLTDLANFATGGDRKACGICFGTGFVDGYQFLSGQRIVLDSTLLGKINLQGVSVLRDSYPNVFEASRKEHYVSWTAAIPTYFSQIISIKVMNNRDHAVGWIAEVYAGSTWIPLTTTWLESRKGQNNTLSIRARPINTSLDGSFLFTHIEIVVRTAELPFGQFPQILKSTNFERIDYYATVECELEPTLPPLNRESVIENTKTGELWKIVDVTNRVLASGQTFGFVLTIRRVTMLEQLNLLRFGNESQIAKPFRGIERVQGDVDNQPPTTTIDPT